MLETAGTFMWGMKKHMAADEAAWRELAKRITLLHAEVGHANYSRRPVVI